MLLLITPDATAQLKLHSLLLNEYHIMFCITNQSGGKSWPQNKRLWFFHLTVLCSLNPSSKDNKGYITSMKTSGLKQTPKVNNINTLGVCFNHQKTCFSHTVAAPLFTFCLNAPLKYLSLKDSLLKSPVWLCSDRSASYKPELYHPPCFCISYASVFATTAKQGVWLRRRLYSRDIKSWWLIWWQNVLMQAVSICL